MAPITRRDLLRGGLALAGLAATTGRAGAFGRPLAPEPLAIARAWALTAADGLALATFDDTHARHPDGSIEILVWPGDRARLEVLGIPHEIVVGDVTSARRAQAVSAVSTQPGEHSGYRRLADYDAHLTALAAAYPAMARLITLDEPTLEGRSVLALEIARDVGRSDGRPTFVMDGLHHAREWPAGELTIMFAYDLLANDGVDPRVTAILDRARVLLVPVQNPDGFNHSRESLVQRPELGGVAGGQEGYWRKNRRSFTGITVAQRNPDAHGTDTNRNYGFKWGGPGGEQDPLSQTYAGPDAFAEPEARALAALMRRRQVTAYITHHTYGRLALRPWGWTTANTADEPLLVSLGGAIAAINGYESRKGIGLYPTAGTSRDWAYGSLRSLVFTLEHTTDFHPFYPNVPPMYALNRPAFLLMAETAMNAAHHGVIRGRALDGDGVGTAGTVTVEKSFDTPRGDGNATIPETVRSAHGTAADGTFAVHVNPSTRPLVALAGGSEAWTVTVEAPGRPAAVRSVTIDRGETVDLGDL